MHCLLGDRATDAAGVRRCNQGTYHSHAWYRGEGLLKNPSCNRRSFIWNSLHFGTNQLISIFFFTLFTLTNYLLTKMLHGAFNALLEFTCTFSFRGNQTHNVAVANTLSTNWATGTKATALVKSRIHHKTHYRFFPHRWVEINKCTNNPLKKIKSEVWSLETLPTLKRSQSQETAPTSQENIL